MVLLWVRLNAAQAELEAVMKNLKEKQQTLASVEQKIAALQKSYDDSVTEKERLEKNMALTQARLKRAGRLTTALADEKTRWEETVAVSQTHSSDILLITNCNVSDLLSPPDNVGERIVFSGSPSATLVCSFVRSFVRTDLVTRISHERLEQP